MPRTDADFAVDTAGPISVLVRDVGPLVRENRDDAERLGFNAVIRLATAGDRSGLGPALTIGTSIPLAAAQSWPAIETAIAARMREVLAAAAALSEADLAQAMARARTTSQEERIAGRFPQN
jgi:hypothetical protein